jgi:Protein of unknown function (DUF3102)
MSAVEKLSVSYADEINHHHKLADEHHGHYIEHSIKTGELLHKQKKRVKRGKWMEWVKDNCDFAYSTAAMYMQCATEKSKGLEISSVRQMRMEKRKIQQELVRLKFEQRKAEKPDVPPDRAFGLEEKSIEDFGQPDDPKLAYYAEQGGEFIARVANISEQITPIKIYKGVPPYKRKKLTQIVRRARTFFHQMWCIEMGLYLGLSLDEIAQRYKVGDQFKVGDVEQMAEAAGLTVDAEDLKRFEQEDLNPPSPEPGAATEVSQP